MVGDLIARKKPRWLMGVRDITGSTNERTAVGGIFPKVGVGGTLIIRSPGARFSAKQVSVLCGLVSSLTFDFIARQKVGGTHLNVFVIQQLPVIPPEDFSDSEIDLISGYVAELTYTSNAMRPWAEDLGYTGAPFAFDPDRRAHLRAEIDAFFARKYGLTRDELRYVLDPHDIKGEHYPSETFRGLRDKEIKQFGEYRTQRLVLEAFDRMIGH